MKPYMMTLTEIADAIKRDELTSLKLVESLLERIQETEHKIHAWKTIEPEAVQKEAKKAINTTSLSRLHGIPLGIKDIYYTKNLRTTMGSPIYSDFVPKYDADIVVRLKEAGAIVLGKTETTEFAVHDPAPTTNPWNTRHTPGGSSSGSAAAVSCGMCPAAFGTQTGGSVIRPASYCGVVGVKPTYGLLSKVGVYPLSWSLDHVGYMTRTVEDAHLMLEVLTSKKRRWIPRTKKPRIGVLRGYFEENAKKEVWTGYEKAVEKLQVEGTEMVDIKLPESFSHVHDTHRIIMASEAASVHEDQFKEKRHLYGNYIQGFIASGLLVPAAAYLRAQRLRSIIIDDITHLMESYDCVVCPSTVDTAPEGLEWTGSPAFNVPWSLTGLPSVTVPIGLSKDRLPIGLQIVGQPYSEWDLLSVAGWCKQKLGFDSRPRDPYEPS